MSDGHYKAGDCLVTPAIKHADGSTEDWMFVLEGVALTAANLAYEQGRKEAFAEVDGLADRATFDRLGCFEVVGYSDEYLIHDERDRDGTRGDLMGRGSTFTAALRAAAGGEG